MTSLRHVAAVLAGCVLGMAMVAPAGLPARADDGDTIFCLGHERSRLVDTAVMLGLVDLAGVPAGEVRPRSAAAGAHLTLEVWRRDAGGDFDRACAALISTVQLEKSGRAVGPRMLTSVLTLLVPLVAGSLLTWLVGLQMAVYNGRLSLAAALRASVRLLRSEADVLVAQLRSPLGRVAPSTDTLWRARADLVTQLEQVAVLRRGRWGFPGEVAATFYDPSFMRNFTQTRFDGDKERAEREVLQVVEELARRVEMVARALQQPFRGHPEMRGAKP